MPDCPVCRRSFDDRFSVFAPPRAEPFDTIECARRAAKAASSEAGDASPLILPTIDVLASLGGQANAVGARDPATGAVRRRAPVPIAVVAGLSLVAAGTASSLYLWSGLPQPGVHATRTAAPFTETPAASGDAAIPPASPVPSTHGSGSAAAKLLTPTSSQSAPSSENADAASSLVGPSATSPPLQPPPASATQAPEPPSPTSPSSPPQHSPSPPAPPTPTPTPPSPNQPAPRPSPAGGENPDAGGTGHAPSAPSTGTSSPTRADAVVDDDGNDDGGAKPKKPTKPKKPKKPPAPSPPAPPPAAIPAVPATPAHPPAPSEDEGGQQGASEPQGNGNGGANGNGNGNGNGKKP